MRVLTLRAAARLLAQTDTLRGLRGLARHLGFVAARALDEQARASLNIASYVVRADLARGDGLRRCLLAQLVPAIESPHAPLSATSDPRELTRLVCAALATHAPARDWCVITIDASSNILCLAAITPHPVRRGEPRTAALRVDRRRVVDSDADTLRSLAAVHEPVPALHHARLADILGREALSNRFYRALEQRVTALATDAIGRAPQDARRELALTCASRCLFLAFLEAKGWLNHDRQFLLHQTTHQLELGGQLHHKLLRPLFFGTLNTPTSQRAAHARRFGHVPFLNGGLFSPTPLERRYRDLRFGDDAIAGLVIDLLDRYRFTAHEDSLRWSEAAVDPEMLGRAFESLMAADERHGSGSYYTPPMLVETVVRDALGAVFPELSDNAFDQVSTPLPAAVRAHIDAIRVLDPACGSGAFLVYTLDALAALRARSGDSSPLHVIRREILTRSIFGVDRNPMAVWLCELRLWLAIVIDCPETHIARIPPLPNLDHHIRLGDSLAGGDWAGAPASARSLTRLRDRYARASGRRKHTLAEALDREERRRAIAAGQRIADRVAHQRCAALDALRTRDLFGQRPPRSALQRAHLLQLRARQREADRHLATLQLGGALPFRYAAQFADVAADGGFALVIGNPPWVRPHALPLAERTRLRSQFRSMRHAAWRRGAARAGAGVGFAAQADLAAAFVERSVQLLSPTGVAALLVPSKLWRALSGGGVREFLAEHTELQVVRDWSHAPALFDAAVYPSLVVAQRRIAAPDAPVTRPTQVAIHQAQGERSFTVAPHNLHLDGDRAAPWLLLPESAHHALLALQAAGPALGDSSLGRPMLGVKCGCNAAFLVSAHERDDETATVLAGAREGVIERQLLRPIVRGESVAAIANDRTHAAARLVNARSANVRSAPTHIVWTHDAMGAPLRTLPARTARWLSHWRPSLERRRDARTRQPWWTLFRTEAARSDAPRVVWADISKRLRPRVLAAGDPTVPLNSCYVLRTTSDEDAFALAALLASPIAAAWFDLLAEPARGGFHRYMGWTVATLPIPRDWHAVRAPLARLGEQHARDRPPTPRESLAVVAHAYGLTPSLLLPLLEWTHQ